jgi:hypothetical protein
MVGLLRLRLPATKPGELDAVDTTTYFETRSRPALARSYPRHFAFYVAHPIRSIETRSLPAL